MRILPPAAAASLRRVELPVPVVRLDPDLPLPAYAHPGDAGADLLTAVDVTLAPGERVLARLRSMGGGKYDGRTFKRLGSPAGARVLGVFQRDASQGNTSQGGRVQPVDKRHKAEWIVPAGQDGGAEPGELVLSVDDDRWCLRTLTRADG